MNKYQVFVVSGVIVAANSWQLGRMRQYVGQKYPQSYPNKAFDSIALLHTIKINLLIYTKIHKLLIKHQ